LTKSENYLVNVIGSMMQYLLLQIRIKVLIEAANTDAIILKLKGFLFHLDGYSRTNR